ncbi:hypothetical protein AGMMS49975_23770 [Clostridia bacterium]|nr:hypothetical protein AGMMS49975_23770 [Clostridia bacterium]
MVSLFGKNHTHEEHKEHTFDSFCKKVLKNEKQNYSKEINNQSKNPCSKTS